MVALLNKFKLLEKNVESFLPSYCYRNSPLKPEAIVIHYFSCINVQPKDPYNMRDCQVLMHDLNLEKRLRFQFLKGDSDTEKRMYASAHCFIGRDGRIALTVPEDKQAYHAGSSTYKGRQYWNGFSYGIELIGSSTSGFTDEQYTTCAKHCARLMQVNGIHIDMVVGHEEITQHRPRPKVDPGMATGNFDMVRLKILIIEELAC